MVHVISLGSTILIMAIQILHRFLHQGDEVGCTIVTVLLDSIGKTQGSHTRYVRTSHRGSLHITVCRLTILYQSREHGTLLLASLSPIFILSLTNLTIVFQITTRSTQGYERTEVGIAGRSIIGSQRRYAHTLGVSTRECRIARILITGSKDSNTAIDYAIWRTSIVDEVIQRFLLQRIGLSPFLLGSRSRSVTTQLATLRGVVTPAALQDDCTIIGSILDGSRLASQGNTVLT